MDEGGDERAARDNNRDKWTKAWDEGQEGENRHDTIRLVFHFIFD
jgi:hypothetical protein